MSLVDALIRLATSAGGGAIVVALIAAIRALLMRSKRAEAAQADKAEAEAEKTEAEADEIERRRWFREAADAYGRLEGEWKGCRKDLRVISAAFYDLLDDLNDIDADDVKTLKAQVRSAARKARAAADYEAHL